MRAERSNFPETDLPEEGWPYFERQRIELIPLVDEQLLSIVEQIDLTPEKTRELILRGVGMLESFELGEGGVFNRKDLQRHPPGPEPILPDQACALGIGRAAMRSFALYLKPEAVTGYLKQRALSLPDEDEDERDNLRVFYENRNENISPWAISWFAANEPVKLDIDHGGYLQTRSLFFYTLRIKDEIYAILPFLTHELDQTLDAPAAGEFSAVYLRVAQHAPDQAAYRQLATEFSQVVTACRQRLGLPPGSVSNLELLFDDNLHYQANAHTYTDSTGHHELLTVGRLKLEACPEPGQRARLVRHEYLHLVDAALGEGGEKEGNKPTTLSQKIGPELVALLNQRLGANFKLAQGGFEFEYETKLQLGPLFSEQYLLGQAAPFGHAGDNPCELFASCLNIYLETDPRLVFERTQDEMGQALRDCNPSLTETEVTQLWGQVQLEVYEKIFEAVEAQIRLDE